MFQKSLKKTRKSAEELPEQAMESYLQLKESQLLISSLSGKPPPVVQGATHSNLLEKQAAV